MNIYTVRAVAESKILLIIQESQFIHESSSLEVFGVVVVPHCQASLKKLDIDFLELAMHLKDALFQNRFCKTSVRFKWERRVILGVGSSTNTPAYLYSCQKKPNPTVVANAKERIVCLCVPIVCLSSPFGARTNVSDSISTGFVATFIVSPFSGFRLSAAFVVLRIISA